MDLIVTPLTEHPELLSGLWDDRIMDAWPAFMLEDPIANLYFGPGRLERFYEFILVAFDASEPDVVLGRGFSVPFCLGLDVHRIRAA